MGKQTTASVRNRNSQLTVQQNETDSPLIPVAQIEKLHDFRPDLVDWVFDQTKTEAEHRRSENKRINTFIFIEHILGQIFAFIIGSSRIIGGVYTAINGQPAAGGTIASLSLTGLAVVFLTGKRKKA